MLVHPFVADDEGPAFLACHYLEADWFHDELVIVESNRRRWALQEAERMFGRSLNVKVDEQYLFVGLVHDRLVCRDGFACHIAPSKVFKVYHPSLQNNARILVLAAYCRHCSKYSVDLAKAQGVQRL